MSSDRYISTSEIQMINMIAELRDGSEIFETMS
jgi:hypothetical protein